MEKSYLRSFVTLFLVFEILISSSVAATDRLDVRSLNDIYDNFGHPPQLKGWKSYGGDPCGDSWEGISCNGTSIIYIKLNGLSLTGQLGESFYSQNLIQLDLSSNYIQGEIPTSLPLNLRSLDLSSNNLSMNIPSSLDSLKNLEYLNLSHNTLFGPVGNIFSSMQNLRRLDLSYNSLSGNLGSMFANLTNITDLYLEENKFTGSAIMLAKLHLKNLNIDNNNITNVLPSYQKRRVVVVVMLSLAIAIGTVALIWLVYVVVASIKKKKMPPNHYEMVGKVIVNEGMTPLEVAAFNGNREDVMALFPVTTPIPSYADWSVDGIIKDVRSKEAEQQRKLKVREKFEELKSKGVAAFHNKDYGGAIVWYSMALREDPCDAPVLSNRSLCWARMGEGERALSDAMECLRLKPEWPKAHYRAGAAWNVLGMFDKAAVAFQEGLKLDPENKELRDALQEAVAARVRSMNVG